MHRWRHWTGNDDGTAALEFIAVGVILLVPLVYLVVALGSIQEQMFGAEAAARHVARVITLAPDPGTARARSEAVLAGVVDEYGLDAAEVQMSLSCRPVGTACPAAGATVTVTVATRVGLPLMPPVFGLDRAAVIPVQASAVQKVSRLWGAT